MRDMKELLTTIRKPGSQLHKARHVRAYNFRLTLPKEMVETCKINEGKQVHQMYDSPQEPHKVFLVPSEYQTATSHPVAVNAVPYKSAKQTKQYAQYKVEVDRFFKSKIPAEANVRWEWDDDNGTYWKGEIVL